MSKENWTKGEWVANVYEKGEFDVVTNPEGSVGGTLILCSRNRFNELSEEMHANAHIIATAPKLYEALKDAAELLRLLAPRAGTDSVVGKCLDSYDQTLAAARGESARKNEKGV